MSFSFIFPCIFAFLLTLSTVPATMRLAKSYGVVDVPDGARHRHARVTPRLGGIAFALSFCVSVPFLQKSASPIAAFGALVALSGAFDDVASISPLKKLTLQVLTATGSALAGLRFNGLSFPLSVALSVLFSVLLMNAQNLVDGLDGLSAALAIVSAAGMLSLSLSVGVSDVAAVLLLFIAAVSGFLPYNIKNAVTFMGDGGSQFLGYALSVFAILIVNAASPDKASAIRLTAKLLICLALPLCDLAFSATRRVIHGHSPFAADRGHLHHRLVDVGFSTGGAVALLSASAASFAVFANVL